MEQGGIQVNLQLAYEVAIDTVMQKEKEIIELKALCNQLASQLHELQHKYNEEH